MFWLFPSLVIVYVPSALSVNAAESACVIGLLAPKVIVQSLIVSFVLFVRISAPLKPEDQLEYSSYLYLRSPFFNVTVSVLRR